jgi:outer membrane receptor protein involved in Fe transport
VVITPNGYTQPGRWFLGGAFAQLVWTPLPALSVTAGGRFDTFEKEADPRFTPRVGLVLKPIDALAVKLLFGQSYLAPMWAHKRANDGNFVGSPNLAPEDFTGYDFIVAYGDKRASATVDVFYNRVKGLINAVNTPGSATYTYLNSGNSVYMGAEFSAEGQLLPWLRLQGSYSYIRPDSNPSRTTPSLLYGDEIKDIPSSTFRYGLRLDPIPRLSASVWGRAYVATKTTDPLSSDTIPAVAVLDASVSYTWPRLTLQVVATNLTDRYYERGGTVARPLARMGINAEGVVAIRF